MKVQVLSTLKFHCSIWNQREKKGEGAEIYVTLKYFSLTFGHCVTVQYKDQGSF